MIIDEVYSGLYEGRLKGADVDWISKFKEAEYIILPTTFYQFRQMDRHEIKENDWKIGDHVNIYITKECISNNDALKTHQDVSHPKKQPDYEDIKNDDEFLDVKNWFVNNVNLPKKEDNIKYYKLFVENGYESMEMIKQEIKCKQDLKDIGIKKIGHINWIFTAIDKMKVTPSNSMTLGFPDDSVSNKSK